MHFDILMIYAFSRAHNCYPNIIKYFKNKGLSIGLIFDAPEKIKIEESLKPNQKLQETEKVFAALCESLGAVICKPEGRFQCNLLIVPQAYFEPRFFEWLKGSIEAHRKIGILLFTGSARGIEHVKELGVTKFYVNDRRTLLSDVADQHQEELIKGIELVSMGSPDKACPVFEGLDIDYLVAFPTPLQLKTADMRYQFYRSAYALISSISKQEKIILKRHSSKDGGNNFYPRSHFMPVWLAGLLIKISPTAVERLPPQLRTPVKDLLSLCLDRLILKRCMLLSRLTPYANLGFEFFLPSVRKGVVTGLSGVIWHCQCFGKRVYNCDTRLMDEKNKHWIHLQHYIVPWCENRLDFDSQKFNRIPEEIRQFNFMKEIEIILNVQPKTLAFT